MLVGLIQAAAGYLGLGDGQPRPMGHQRQQVDGLAQPVEAAASRLAVRAKASGGPSAAAGTGPSRPSAQRVKAASKAAGHTAISTLRMPPDLGGAG